MGFNFNGATFKGEVTGETHTLTRFATNGTSDRTVPVGERWKIVSAYISCRDAATGNAYIQIGSSNLLSAFSNADSSSVSINFPIEAPLIVEAGTTISTRNITLDDADMAYYYIIESV